jgi:hypothetical protein
MSISPRGAYGQSEYDDSHSLSLRFACNGLIQPVLSMLWLSLSVDKNSQVLTNRNRDASMPLNCVALYPELDSKWNPAKDV